MQRSFSPSTGNGMYDPDRRIASIVGPEGQSLTRDSLPAPGTKRWVIRRKAEVVAAVRGGLLTLDEACERYRLTTEEFLSWQRAIEQHGLAGLRTTRLQDYRPGSLKPGFSQKTAPGRTPGS